MCGRRDLKRDLEASEAKVSAQHRQRVQTALLTEVFTVYFRVMKQAVHSPALPAVLRGLAKFASLINIELGRRRPDPTRVPPCAFESGVFRDQCWTYWSC